MITGACTEQDILFAESGIIPFSRLVDWIVLGGDRMGNLKSVDQKGGVAIPAIMWFAGVPLGLVIVLWLLFFR